MHKLTLITVLVAAMLSTAASATDKDEKAYLDMIACFTDTAEELADYTTPLDDMADVVIGMCWGKVDYRRQRLVSDWGYVWSGFVGPYFVLELKSHAKEVIYKYRKAVMDAVRETEVEAGLREP